MTHCRARHLVLAAALVGGSAIPLTSCADNDSALFVRGVLALEAPDCIAQGDSNATLLGFGYLDREFSQTYQAALLVGNQLVRRGSRDQLRTETSRVRLSGAIVEIAEADGDALTEYSTIGTGFVDPATGEEPGYGVMFATLLPLGIGADGEVVSVTVRVFGETLGGVEIESAELTFPIVICRGCLVQYTLEANDPTAPIGTYTCSSAGEGALDLGCFPGQDHLIDCRLCAGTHAICRDPSLNLSGGA